MSDIETGAVYTESHPCGEPGCSLEGLVKFVEIGRWSLRIEAACPGWVVKRHRSPNGHQSISVRCPEHAR